MKQQSISPFYGAHDRENKTSGNSSGKLLLDENVFLQKVQVKQARTVVRLKEFNCRMPGHLFAIRIAIVVLCLVLQSTPTQEK